MSLQNTLVAVLLMCLLAGCSLLESEPTNGEDLEEPGLTGFYAVEQISPVDPPFGDIDGVFLDGVIPDAVSFDIMSGRLWRFHVLERGVLRLSEAGQFSLRLHVAEYTTSPGEDEGPHSAFTCTASGSFSEADEALLLRGADPQEGDVSAKVAGPNTLRIERLGTTCTFEFRGTVYSRDFHLSGIELVKDES